MPKPRLIKPISKILDEPISKLDNIPDYYIEDEHDEDEVEDTFDKFNEDVQGIPEQD